MTMKLLILCLIVNITAGSLSGADNSNAEKWKALLPAGKGVCIVKLQKEKETEFVFFEGTNGPRYTSTLAKIGVHFTTLEAAVSFASEKPLGVVLFFAHKDALDDDAKTLLEMSPAEIELLGKAADGKSDRK
jgi:hypothetical protein